MADVTFEGMAVKALNNQVFDKDTGTIIEIIPILICVNEDKKETYLINLNTDDIEAMSGLFKDVDIQAGITTLVNKTYDREMGLFFDNKLTIEHIPAPSRKSLWEVFRLFLVLENLESKNKLFTKAREEQTEE